MKKFKESIKYITIGALATSVMLFSCLSIACSKKTSAPSMNINYGSEIGIAVGSVDLSGDTPVVSISAIKAEVGTNIDYLSQISIANEGDFPDLEIWVDASTVDIFTPGNYTAIYTFNYGGKSISQEVTVTMTESQTEQSASSVKPSAGTTQPSTNSSDNSTSQTTSSDVSNTTSGNNSSSTQTTSKNDASTSTEETTTKAPDSTTTQPTTTKNPGGTTKPTTTKPTTTKPTTTKTPGSTSNQETTTKAPGNTTTETTTREIITTTGNSTTKMQYIGNLTIELLSGKTVTIRNTTSKYIISTRTDVTYTERNGYKYKVSKLIITYNTGAEQILETLEERVK